MFCNDCKKKREIIQLGQVWHGTKYEDGMEYVYYPLLKCGHYGHISTSPIGDIPSNAQEILSSWR